MTSLRRRHTQVSYNVDPYKELDSDAENGAIMDVDSGDEEFDPEGSLVKGKSKDGNHSNGGNDYKDDDEGDSDGQSEAFDVLSDGEEQENEDSGDNDDDEQKDASENEQEGKTKKRRAPHPGFAVRINRRPGLPAKSNSKRERIETIYGNDVAALVAGIKARDLWILDPVIPHRKNLSYTPFFDETQLEIVDLGNGEQTLQWLDYGCDKEEIEKFLPAEDSKLRCILGPLGGQKIITFSRFGICDLSTAHKGRAGHMLNAGGHVVGMDWAPNRPNGFQYLAISIKSPHQTVPEKSLDVPHAYARRPGPAHIQIWRVPADSARGTVAGKPSLALIICHEWGVVQSLKWCPIPKKIEDPTEIGHLAAVFGDGAVRVIQVCFQEEDVDKETSFARITKPLFEGNLPDTLCTCLAWLSTHEIAAGCSNGFAAVWDIRHTIAPENKNIVIPPHHYLPLHQTYILDIQSCFPSYPNTIVTSSMDGHCRLTSLFDPQADTILTGRSRLSSNSVAWVDCIHTVLASEEGTWVKMYPLRRFWSSTSVARQSQGGVILSLGASKCHPFVLAGGGEGEVIVFNPLRKTFHGKIKVYQQTWFQIEYSPKSDMYRIMEGFRMEKISFKSETKGSKGDGHSTVFEERGGITKVGWNQNPEFGGWAAAGTAGGLVRVEDLAI
ncbi:hypothetical protein BDZ91DRAFT_792740 [Kalaharituber pfeilii]|nr:hypothetical protein BDZ91DRAFT_792740 [Kalaharituber pfeilii]